MYSHSHSAILVDGIALPSVTKILSTDPKKKSYYKSRGLKRKTEHIDGVSPSVGRHRGVSLHAAFSDFITTGEADVPPIYYSHWEQLQSLVNHLELGPIIWAERPLLEEHSRFQQGDTSAIYSKKYKYLGKPDLIAGLGGCNCVFEIKTSEDLMTKNFNYKQFQTYSQYLPYAHAGAQVASYAHAWTECTGQTIDAGVVINVTSTASQLFILEKPELDTRFKNFKTLARAYHKANA